jgi:PAS domain S-box-containing protein
MKEPLVLYQTAMKHTTTWTRDPRIAGTLLFRAAFLVGGFSLLFFNFLWQSIQDLPPVLPWDLWVNAGLCFTFFSLSFLSSFPEKWKQRLYDVFLFAYAAHTLVIFVRNEFNPYFMGLTLVAIQGLIFVLRSRILILSYLVMVNAVLMLALWRFPLWDEAFFTYLPGLFLVASFVGGLVQWTRIENLEAMDQAREVALTSHANLIGLMEGTEDMVWSIDPEYRIQFMNQPFERMVRLFYGDDFRLDLPIRSFVAAQSVEIDAVALTDQVFQGEKVSFYNTIRLDAYRDLVYHISLHPIVKDGKVTGAAGFAKETTELYHTQEQLKRMQERYENAAKATNDGLWEWDLANGTLYFSPRWKEILGYTDAELPNTTESWLQLMHPDDRDWIAQLLTDHIKGESTALTAEYRMLHKSGQVIWVSSRGMATRDEKGRALRLSGTQTEITDRKAAEKELKRLSLVASKTLNGVIISDSQGAIEWVNEGFTQITGFELSEVVGRKPGSFLQGELTNHKTRLEMSRAIHDKRPVSVEVVNYHKNGHSYWIRASITPVFSEKGEIENFIAIQEDITERKKAEEEMRKLSLVASKTLSGVVISDAEGKVEWVNDGFEKMTGYTLSDIRGKRPGQLLHGPLTQSATKERMKSAIMESRPVTDEVINYRKDGKPYWVRVSITPVFNEWGNLEKFIAIQDEISARKEAEHELIRAKEAAEAASQAKADFLANMSHEIRTPMNAVIGMTGLLLSTDLNDEQRDFVETIRNSGDNLLTIINDILDFSKIDAGKLELERYAFNLVDCIENVVDLFAAKASEKDIELMADIDPGLPLQMMSDPTRLTQVLSNLVSNAIKFTPKGGEVLVSARMEVHTGNAMIRFGVSDTGIGIPGDKVANLFQSFSQVDTSITRKFGGTGLGLAISRKLVNLMGGEITVESEEGNGSVFHFSVPFEPGEVTEIPIPMDHGLWKGKKVLIVDDNETNLTIFEHQCRSWGMIPVLVSDPAKAVSSLEAHPDCALAILDMQMPDLSGVDLARVLHRFRPDMALSLISSVGVKLKEGDRRLFKAIGMKPIRRSQLLRVIQQCLEVSPEVMAESGGEQKETQPLAQGMRILVAEDNAVNQKVAMRMLEKLGIRADFVSNGREACQALAMSPYDLVFMDVQMPEMDGLEATRTIRAMRNIAHQPIIVAMTANALKGDKERCLEAGMDDYISKPVRIPELAEMLGKWNQNQVSKRIPAD